MQTTTGPMSGLCAACGCGVHGDRVVVTHEYDRVLKRALPTYWHLSAQGCAAAQARSAAFWRQQEATHANGR